MNSYFLIIFIHSLFISCTGYGILYANKITSVCDGNWSDSTTWDSGVPSSSDSVSIFHNVRLDASVVLNLPASLYISASGELCGYASLQCEFTADGPLSAGTLTIEGNSVNNAMLISASDITVNGSWQLNGGACVGCSFTCPAIMNPCTSPTCNFNSSDTILCNGSCINLTDLSAGFPSSWQWSFQGASPATSTLQNPQNICYTAADTYNIKLVVTNINGSDSITKTVIVNPLPIADFSYSPVCEYDAVEFFNTSTVLSGIITSADWDFGDGNTSVSFNPSYLYSDGIFIATLGVMTDKGCYDTVMKTIIVYPMPLAFFGSTNACLFDDAQFVDNSTINGGSIISWEWDFGDGTPLIFNQNTLHQYSVDGYYDVRLVVISAYGCRDTIVKLIQIYPIPIADFTTSPVCLYDTAAFTDLSTGYIVSWEWNFEDGSPLNFNQNPAHQYSTDGIYNVKLVVVSNYNCKDTIVQYAIIYPIPVAGAGQDTAICSGNSVMLNATGGITYGWNPVTALSDPNISNPSANPATTTTYWVTVFDSNGCQDVDSVTITVATGALISGHVFDSIIPVTGGIVKLREYHTNPTLMIDIDSSYIDSAGYYIFSNSPAGQYLIIARADTTLYPNLVATYYDSTNHWQKANIVSAVCPNPITTDIHLINFPATIGHGTISGKVHGSGPQKKAGYDFPLAGLDLYLEKGDLSGVSGFAITDTLGRYSFKNIPEGTYTIYLDVPGLVMDTTYTVIVTATDSVFLNFDFCVDSTFINICNLNGFVFEAPVIDGGLKVFPNPYIMQTNIFLRLENKAVVSLKIYNILGVNIHTLYMGAKEKGDYHFIFSAQKSGSSSGINVLKLIVNDKVYTVKLVEM